MSRALALGLFAIAIVGIRSSLLNAAENDAAVAAPQPAIDAKQAAAESPLVKVETPADQPTRVLHRTAPFDGPWYANHEMPLRTDGNLPGVLRRFDDAGNLVPVRARLFFIQHNQVVMQTMSEEGGHFQVTGLAPGVYSVVAASPEGFGAFSIRILPSIVREAPPANNVNDAAPPVQSTGFRKTAYDAAFFEDANLTMTVPLVPPGDYQAVSQIVNNETNNFNSPDFAGPLNFSGSGGAGGAGGAGGGFGGLAAAGAIAGTVTAIATSGSGSTTVTDSNTTP